MANDFVNQDQLVPAQPPWWDHFATLACRLYSISALDKNSIYPVMCLSTDPIHLTFTWTRRHSPSPLLTESLLRTTLPDGIRMALATRPAERTGDLDTFFAGGPDGWVQFYWSVAVAYQMSRFDFDDVVLRELLFQDKQHSYFPWRGTKLRSWGTPNLCST